MTDAPTFPLYMIQLQPDAIRVGLWMASEGLSRQGADDGYGWHALLKAAFGDLAPKPFRIIEHARKPLQLLAYSQADEGALRDQAATFAEPDGLICRWPALRLLGPCTADHPPAPCRRPDKEPRARCLSGRN